MERCKLPTCTLTWVGLDLVPSLRIDLPVLDATAHIVETQKGHFKPGEFEDQYEDALKELLKKKQHGEKIEAPRERAPSKVINLMEALRRSVEGAKSPARPEAASHHRVPKKATNTKSKHKKAS